MDADDATNDHLISELMPQVAAAIAPWLAHFGDMGLVRADGLHSNLLADLTAADFSPTFYRVCRAADANLDPAMLGALCDAEFSVDALPGGKLVVTGSVQAINATVLHEAVTALGAVTGLWGGRRYR